MEGFVDFTNRSQGRDQLFRATQYTCMLLSYLIERKADKEKLVMKLKQLESSMSSGRKMFRLGNMVHALVAARRTTQLPDVVPRFCLTASNLTRALYFVCDAVLWLKSVGLQPDIDKPKWRNWATKCYYFSLLMNLARDWYEISWRVEQAVQEEKTKENSFWDKHSEELNCVKCDSLQGFFLLLFQILKSHPPLLLDLVKNLCDLSGPLDTLGIYKTNPGVIGFCGVLSSLVGILTLASPHLKLKQ
ncbi:PREDICTED: peroxisomal membrane protein 11A [Calidris pugnax]|uniref:peroxisomal membrane protein 11A n=1 Tax=Calidris pugnax TaxID=198806 RepID=UPI00071D6A5F|nr:PREDICTED: peroxisomal membrane protein 11A [Calidris pugnax]XP_014800277.1 PREDICTED: peroxisomal membrane protein 11A [Calidris pugnax]